MNRDAQGLNDLVFVCSFLVGKLPLLLLLHFLSLEATCHNEAPSLPRPLLWTRKVTFVVVTEHVSIQEVRKLSGLS